MKNTENAAIPMSAIGYITLRPWRLSGNPSRHRRKEPSRVSRAGAGMPATDTDLHALGNPFSGQAAHFLADCGVSDSLSPPHCNCDSLALRTAGREGEHRRCPASRLRDAPRAPPRSQSGGRQSRSASHSRPRARPCPWCGPGRARRPAPGNPNAWQKHAGRDAAPPRGSLGHDCRPANALWPGPRTAANGLGFSAISRSFASLRARG